MHHKPQWADYVKAAQLVLTLEISRHSDLQIYMNEALVQHIEIKGAFVKQVIRWLQMRFAEV